GPAASSACATVTSTPTPGPPPCPGHPLEERHRPPAERHLDRRRPRRNGAALRRKLMYWLMAVLVTALLAALLVRGRGLLGAQGRQSIRMAVRNLLLHKLRSFLSVLGIIIGTAAVVVLTALGEGSMRDALEDIKRQGATNLIVRSVWPAEEAGRGPRDARI